jgi:hypothetical protein
MGIIDGGVAVGHFHKPPPFQRRELSVPTHSDQPFRLIPISGSD